MDWMFSGNYFKIFFNNRMQYSMMMSLADKFFSYEIKKWNNELRTFEYITIRRYWFDPEQNSFTTYRGLAVRAKKILEKIGYTIKPVYRELAPDWAEAWFLRKYQFEALREIIKQIQLQGASTLQCATGGGKTEVAVALHKVLKPKKTFFLSLNTDLLIQARDRFRKYGVDAGLVNKDYFEIDREVVCCTVQTLYRAIRTYETYTYEGGEEVNEEVKHLLEETNVKDKLKLYETYRKAELIILDECQHVPARTVWYTSMSNPNALRLALSATPWREAWGLTLRPPHDGRDLDIYACYGDIIPRRITSSELIEQGYLVPVKIYFAHYFPPYAKEFEGRRGSAWLYNKVKKAVFSDPVRNRKIAELATKVPKPFMILVKEITHGEKIAQECRRLGLKVAFLYGEVNPDIRARIFNMVRRAQIDGIVCTTLADRATPAPA